MGQGSKIINAYFLVVLCTVLGRVLGLLREMVIAYKFGTSSGLDAYFMAMAIPSFFEQALFMAIPVALIPVYMEYLSSDSPHEGLYFINNVFNILLVLMAIIVTLTWFGAPVLFKFLAPGFKGEVLHKTILSYRILAILPIFFLLSSTSTGILNAHYHFLTPAVRPVVLNLCIILFLLLWSNRIGIYSLVYGTLAAGILQLLVQLPSLVKRKINYKFILNFSHSSFVHIRKNMVIIFCIFGLGCLNPIIARILASTLDPGSISVLNYKDRLATMIMGVFAVPLATVLLPVFSELAQKKKMKELSGRITRAIKYLIFVIIPITAFILIFRAEIVRLLFERGNFSANDSQVVALLLLYQSGWFFCFPIILILTHTLFALKETLPLLWASVFFVTSYSLFASMLLGYLGLVALPLAASIASSTYLFHLMIITQKRAIAVDWGIIAKNSMKTGMLSLSAFVPIYLFLNIPMQDSLGVHLFAKFGFTLFLFILSFLLLSYFFKIDEFIFIKDFIKNRLCRLFPKNERP